MLSPADVEQVALIYFFFQAEDGIRDLTVTGVQTCALPIYGRPAPPRNPGRRVRRGRHALVPRPVRPGDRKSTRLNSSHSQISYAVFCLKKKKIHLVMKESRDRTVLLQLAARGDIAFDSTHA